MSSNYLLCVFLLKSVKILFHCDIFYQIQLLLKSFDNNILQNILIINKWLQFFYLILEFILTSILDFFEITILILFKVNQQKLNQKKNSIKKYYQTYKYIQRQNNMNEQNYVFILFWFFASLSSIVTISGCF
ncbi:hypothetical protein pb186bvf_011215 [Paramecium bursaria]